MELHPGIIGFQKDFDMDRFLRYKAIFNIHGLPFLRIVYGMNNSDQSTRTDIFSKSLSLDEGPTESTNSPGSTTL